MTGRNDNDQRELDLLEAKLTRLAKKAPPEKDERFWTDFSRNVRVALDAPKKPPLLSRWLVLLPIGAAALASIALVAYMVTHRPSHDRAPAIAAASRAVSFDPDWIQDDLDLDEVLEDLNTDQLNRVAVALGVNVADTDSGKKGG